MSQETGVRSPPRFPVWHSGGLSGGKPSHSVKCGHQRPQDTLLPPPQSTEAMETYKCRERPKLVTVSWAPTREKRGSGALRGDPGGGRREAAARRAATDPLVLYSPSLPASRHGCLSLSVSLN